MRLSEPVYLVAILLIQAPLLMAGGDPCVIETFAGGDTFSVGDGLPATEAELFFPTDARRGPDGLLYIADLANHRIRRVTAEGTMETFAGTGNPGLSPDGTPRLQALLNGPRKLAFGSDGSLYFSEASRIRRIRSDGSVVTVAGNGSMEFSGDGGPAVAAGVAPRSLTVDMRGRVFLASLEHRRVRMVDTDGTISTVAGVDHDRPFNDGMGGPATDARLGAPLDVAVGPDGLLYIASALDVLRILSDGTIETYVSSSTGSRDATKRTEISLQVRAIEASQTDLIYQSNLGIVRFDASDELVTLEPGEQLPSNYEFAAQPSGQVFVIDSYISEIRELTPDGQVAIAGAGENSKRGDGGPAVDAYVSGPQRLDEGPDGSIYFLDVGLDNVRRVSPDGIISTVYRYDNSTGERRDLAVGPDGAVYMSWRFIYRVKPGETPEFSPGGNMPSFSRAPVAMDVDSKGNLYLLADSGLSVPYFYQLNPEGEVVTALTERFDNRPQHVYVDASDTVHIVGQRWHTFTPTGGLVRNEALEGFEQHPRAVAFAADQTLYLAPFDELHRVDRVRPGLIRDRITGAEEAGFSGDGGPASDALLDFVGDLLVASDGSLYIADRNNRRVRRIRNPDACPSPGPRPWPSRYGMVNGAFGAAITPGAVFSLFGTRLGPAQIQTAELTAEGRLPTAIAGTRVFFDGVPAPLLFVLDGQLSGVVPFSTKVTVVNGPQGSSTVDWSDRPEIIVERNGVPSEPELYHVHNASPAIFTVGSAIQGPAAALNQDGSLNTAANPAARGSIITFWATGFGALSPTPVDGSVNTAPFAQPQLPVQVEFGFQLEAEILYSGSAPGLAAGVMQVNARVPLEVTDTEPRVVLRVGDAVNQGQFATVFVAP